MKWPHTLARQFISWGLTPNIISLLSILFALLGGACFFYTYAYENNAYISMYLIAALCIQLRLLCNMLDGLMAVEGGKQSKIGELYNEIPDRVTDTLFLVGAGYASGYTFGSDLGWLAAVLSIGTAYIRALGANRGFKQDFSGPMAKPHRMFILTIATLFAAVETYYRLQPRSILIGLVLVILGTVLTGCRRMMRLAKKLNDMKEI